MLYRPVYLASHQPGYQSKIILLILLILKLFDYEDESIKNIIQVKYSCFLCHIVPYAKLKVWGQAVHASLS